MSAAVHGHFLCTRLLPCSSYSAFDIHICWKDPRDARIDPPAQPANVSDACSGSEAGVPSVPYHHSLVLGALTGSSSASWNAACYTTSKPCSTLSPAAPVRTDPDAEAALDGVGRGRNLDPAVGRGRLRDLLLQPLAALHIQ